MRHREYTPQKTQINELSYGQFKNIAKNVVGYGGGAGISALMPHAAEHIGQAITNLDPEQAGTVLQLALGGVVGHHVVKNALKAIGIHEARKLEEISNLPENVRAAIIVECMNKILPLNEITANQAGAGIGGVLGAGAALTSTDAHNLALNAIHAIGSMPQTAGHAAIALGAAGVLKALASTFFKVHDQMNEGTLSEITFPPSPEQKFTYDWGPKAAASIGGLASGFGMVSMDSLTGGALSNLTSHIVNSPHFGHALAIAAAGLLGHSLTGSALKKALNESSAVDLKYIVKEAIQIAGKELIYRDSLNEDIGKHISNVIKGLGGAGLAYAALKSPEVSQHAETVANWLRQHDPLLSIPVMTLGAKLTHDVVQNAIGNHIHKQNTPGEW